MGDALYFAPLRTPLTDSRTGLMSREWYLFFQALWLRTGGVTGMDELLLSQPGADGLNASDLVPSITSLGQEFGQLSRAELGDIANERIVSMPPPPASYSEVDKLFQDLSQAPVMAPQVTPHLEFGNWTPTDASGAGLVITMTSSTYVKHDRLVLARTQITYPVNGSGLDAKIGGLPFTVENIESARQGWVSYGTTANLRYFLPVLNTTTAQFYQSSGATMTNALMSGVAVYLAALYTTP
jgi:hypothetical protein